MYRTSLESPDLPPLRKLRALLSRWAMPSQSTPTILVCTYFTSYLDENFFPNCFKKDPPMIYHFSEDLVFFLFTGDCK